VSAVIFHEKGVAKDYSFSSHSVFALRSKFMNESERGTVSRIRLALIMIAMEHGGHIDMPCVEFIQCSAYRLEPIAPGSFNDLDGEVVESGPIQAAVLPKAIQAYCNPSYHI
jgi:diacylglycerol kinase family enzyme